MSEERIKLLDESITMLNEIKNKKKNEIEELKDNIKKLQDTYNELLNEEPSDYSNDEIEALKEEISVNEGILDAADELFSIYDSEYAYIIDILNTNANLIGFDSFGIKVSKLRVLGNIENGGIISGEIRHGFDNMSRVTGIKFPLSSKEIDILNDAYKRVELGALMLSPVAPEMGIVLTTDKKREKVDKIKEDVKTLQNYYEKMISFMNKVVEYIKNDTNDIKDNIELLKLRGINSGKQEILEAISEINDRINQLLEDIKSIDSVNELYEEYNNTSDRSILIKLTSKLKELEVLKSRDAKLIEYEPTEKDKIEEETPVIEETPLEGIKAVELDNDYFRNKDTNYIVCFLGEEGDTINEDINNHFDKSKVKPVLSELFTLFTVLTTTNDYIKDKGGNPHEGSAKKALALLNSPLDFAYKRFGVRNDNFRIHAITRNSSLLKELGFGSGNIIFFGAVGVNDDKEKSDAYNRLGTRAIDQLSNKNDVPKLRPNFDFIEHITRGYIPKKLFSDEDIKKSEKGMFLSKLKGNIDMSIEHGRFVLYDLLDDSTKSNVKKYLDDYFIKQTNMLFEIKDKYDKAIGDYS